MREVGKQKAAMGPGGIDAVLYLRSGRSGTDHAKKNPAANQSVGARGAPREVAQLAESHRLKSHPKKTGVCGLVVKSIVAM